MHLLPVLSLSDSPTVQQLPDQLQVSEDEGDPFHRLWRFRRWHGSELASLFKDRGVYGAWCGMGEAGGSRGRRGVRGLNYSRSLKRRSILHMHCLFARYASFLQCHCGRWG